MKSRRALEIVTITREVTSPNKLSLPCSHANGAARAGSRLPTTGQSAMPSLPTLRDASTLTPRMPWM